MLKQILIEHALTGWHRSKFDMRKDRKLQTWHEQRIEACRLALSQIRSGKDVFQHLLKNGWLDLHVQLMPYTANGLAVDYVDIKKFAFAFVLAQHRSLDKRAAEHGVTVFWKKGFAGLVDSRLRVRPFIIQTPPVRWLGGGTIAPNGVFRPEYGEMINQIHQRYEAVQKYLEVKYRSWDTATVGEVSHEFGLNCYGGIQFKTPKFLCYDEERKKVKSLLISSRDDLKAVIFFGKWQVAIGIYPGDPWLHITRQLLQLQMQPPICCEFIDSSCEI